MEINKIYNEDCLITMNNMEDNFVDYCITSPPYNISDKSLSKYKDFTDDMSKYEYFENQKKVIEEMLRITKKHIFYNIQMVSGNKLALHKLIGYFSEYIKEVLIWQKTGQPAISEKVFNSAFEYIIIFSKDSPDKRIFHDANFNRGTQSNIFKIKNSHSNKYAAIHKAVFPLDLPRYFMQNFGNNNDIWYDPYFGTGTSGLAAVMENKNYIGNDISKEYIKLAENRIKQHTNQKRLF